MCVYFLETQRFWLILKAGKTTQFWLIFGEIQWINQEPVDG